MFEEENDLPGMNTTYKSKTQLFNTNATIKHTRLDEAFFDIFVS